MVTFEIQNKRLHEKTTTRTLTKKRYSRTPAFNGGCDDTTRDQNITKNNQTEAE